MPSLVCCANLREKPTSELLCKLSDKKPKPKMRVGGVGGGFEFDDQFTMHFVTGRESIEQRAFRQFAAHCLIEQFIAHFVTG
eukprot:Gb_00803 [translate_table: standard]